MLAYNSTQYSLSKSVEEGKWTVPIQCYNGNNRD